MLGDQLALAWVVKSHLPSALRKFTKHKAFTGEVNGASVLFLPCAVYNWTPPEGAGQFHGMPLDVKVQLLSLVKISLDQFCSFFFLGIFFFSDINGKECLCGLFVAHDTKTSMEDGNLGFDVSSP